MAIPVRALSCFALAATASLTGCVERRITIATDPPGAVLLLNDVEVGRTPVSVPFTTYGDYDIRLRYEKNVGTPESPKIVRYYLHTHRETKIPWFEFFGADLISELSPTTVKDEQLWAFAIPEVQEPTDADLIERARALKEKLGTTQPAK
ncbi:MAG TPA: PEGA domain-containing protein [Phycisphaerae bacterium]|jgi:hypothetical protein